MLSKATYEAMRYAVKVYEPQTLKKLMAGLDEDQLLLALNHLDERGHSLLLYTVLASPCTEVGHYQCAILLLEAGANPLLLQGGESYDRTPMTAAILSKQLGLARLMMPYAPAFDPEEWRREIPGVTDWIKAAAIDFKNVYELEKTARTLLSEEKYEDAAEVYEKIVSIYEKHERLEAGAVVSDYEKHKGCTDRIFYYSRLAQIGYTSAIQATSRIAASPAELRAVSQRHFYDKKMGYLNEVYSCRRRAQSSATEMPVHAGLNLSDLRIGFTLEAPKLALPFSITSLRRRRVAASAASYQRI